LLNKEIKLFSELIYEVYVLYNNFITIPIFNIIPNVGGHYYSSKIMIEKPAFAISLVYDLLSDESVIDTILLLTCFYLMIHSKSSLLLRHKFDHVIV